MASRNTDLLFPLTLLFLLMHMVLGTAAPAGAETLTLKECLERADRNNPELRAAAWDRQVAETAVRQAQASSFPRVDGQVGYTMQQTAQAVKINGITAETQEPDYAFGGLAVTYTLYDFGRRSARQQQAGSQSAATASLYEARRSDLALRVIEAYYGILERERLVNAAREEVAQVEQHRRMAQAMFEEGVVTRNDVLQAEVRLAAARQRLLATENQWQNGWLRLNYLTGTPSAYRATLDDSVPTSAPGQETPYERAIEQRHELRALRHSVSAGEAAVSEARGDFYPELYARLGLDYLQNDKVREQTIMSATVGLRFNIFDGFATTALRERAVANRSRSSDLLRQAEEQVRLEVDTARNDLRVARERVTVAETAIRQGEENLRINRERYQERVGTATEVLDAQTLLTQARTDHFRALFDQQVAAARLKRAAGEL